jgi:LPS export ABC transporter protein LptC
MKQSVRFIVPFVLLILGLYCTVYSLNSGDNSTVPDLLSKDQGTVIVDKLSIREYQKKTPIHQVQAKHISFSEKSQQLQIQFFKMNIKENDGTQSVVEGDKSIFNISTRIFNLMNNVHFHSGKGGVLSCDSLQWDMRNDRIVVPGKFTLVKDNAILRAANLVTNRNLETGEMHNLEAINR